MRFSETPETPTPAINVVPLVGVLAALMVVVLAAFVPRPTSSYTRDNDLRSCFFCAGPTCGYRDHLALQVIDAGHVRIEGADIAQEALPAAIRLTPTAANFNGFYVRIGNSQDADYGAVMTTVATLKRMGLRDEQIRMDLD